MGTEVVDGMALVCDPFMVRKEGKGWLEVVD